MKAIARTDTDTSRVLALAGFALRSNLRSAMWRGGMVAFVLIAGFSLVSSWRSSGAWSLESDFLYFGYLTAALFCLRSGLAQQRETGLLTYLRHNFVQPLEHAAGVALALVGNWGLITALLFALALICSAGDAAAAAWLAWSYGLWMAVLLPFVLLVESVSGMRTPLLIPVLGYFALAVILSGLLGTRTMMGILAIGGDRHDPSAWIQVGARGALVLSVGLGSFLLLTWAGDFRRRHRSGRTGSRGRAAGRSTRG